ncbi:hypothetical protein PAXRUDRAFT_167415, partial [Paxillus rubicundulus Ve08.2h10]
VYHINWLRAKAVQDQWKEEVKLIKSEVQWTINFLIPNSSSGRNWVCKVRNRKPQSMQYMPPVRPPYMQTSEINVL